MEEIINTTKQINAENLVMGLVFILLGVAIGVFKITWLIAGSSALSYMDEEVVDYIAIFFGLFLGSLGGFFILSAFNLDIINYLHSSMAGAFVMLFALIFAVLCTCVIAMIRSYKKKNKDKYSY